MRVGSDLRAVVLLSLLLCVALLPAWHSRGNLARASRNMPTTLSEGPGCFDPGFSVDALCPQAPQNNSSSSSDGAKAVASVQRLISRFLPDHAASFSLQLCPTPQGCHGFFTVEVAQQQVQIAGTSGVELASGFHWFLKHFCNSSISWELTGGPQINSHCMGPDSLHRLQDKGQVRVERAVEHTFYQNVVTLSYSMAFWEWDRWEAELDWMALQGINLALMPLGMEALWWQVFQGLGLAPQELEDFFPGPAFLAWGRMGNIQGYQGPLPAAYRAKQLDTARLVVARMRQLGIVPVFPAFAGFVPRALAAHFPEARLTPSSNWCHFPPAYCCPLLLEPGDPLFARIGSAYIARLRQELGWDGRGYYIADSFNEMKPASADPAYLAGISASVFKAMAAADPSAVWLMQAWLFFSDHHFWQPPQIQALLSGVPRGRLVLLDLFADEHPVWSRTEAFYGYPFIWCMLHNFGGNMEMYGALPQVAEGVLAAMTTAPNLCGVGMAPEGIEQNPVVYEFMAELAYKGQAAARANSGIGPWLTAYALRRYAAAGEVGPGAAATLVRAWSLLGRSVYSCSDRLHNTVADIPTSRPGLSRAEITGWGLSPHLWYDVGDVKAAWEALLVAATVCPALPSASSAFVYDLLDVARELMSKVAGRFWKDATDAYHTGDLAGLQAAGARLTDLLSDMDTLLASHKAFLLGPQLQRARAYAAGRGCDAKDSSSGSSNSSFPIEQQQQQAALASLYERNLRTQLTIWGTSLAGGDSEVSDYANREWSGLISGFYLPRWRAWLARLEGDLLAGRPYDALGWQLEVLGLTYAWIGAEDGQALPAEPAGDPVVLARQAHERWACLLASSGPVLEAAGPVVQLGVVGGAVEVLPAANPERPAAMSPVEEMPTVA